MSHRLLLHLRLHLILHPIHLLRLLNQQHILLFAKRTLLILLRDVARRAATRTQAVCAAVSCQMVFGAHVAPVEHGHDERYADAGEAAETHALWGWC
jgi:hypothetical protein